MSLPVQKALLVYSDPPSPTVSPFISPPPPPLRRMSYRGNLTLQKQLFGATGGANVSPVKCDLAQVVIRPAILLAWHEAIYLRHKSTRKCILVLAKGNV